MWNTRGVPTDDPPDILEPYLKPLECGVREGENPVGGDPGVPECVPEYHGARETPWEAGWPTTQDYRPSVTDSAEYREGTVKSPPGGE